MNIELKHQPAFTMAKITLDPNESVVAESGSLLSKSTNVDLQTSAMGGIAKSLGRTLFGGESFFMNTYTAGANGGEVSLTPKLPGDIYVQELEKPLYIQSGAFLGAASSIQIDTKWGGAKGFFSGAGLLLLGATGSGKIMMSTYGSMELLELQAGEEYVVDTGHIMAFDQDIDYSINKVGSWKSTLLSGEFIVATFRGPGKILMQTRSQSALIDWIYSKLPKNYSSSN